MLFLFTFTAFPYYFSWNMWRSPTPALLLWTPLGDCLACQFLNTALPDRIGVPLRMLFRLYCLQQHSLMTKYPLITIKTFSCSSQWAWMKLMYTNQQSPGALWSISCAIVCQFSMWRSTERWPCFPPRLPRTERSGILSALSAQYNRTVTQSLQNLCALFSVCLCTGLVKSCG